MDTEKKKVLVIDDNPDIHNIISRTLSGTEFLFIGGALEGRKGIQIAKEHKPDVILLDIIMPGFDGFITGKILKRNLDTKNIPIIFISGAKTKEHIHAAIQAGGSDYIVKPFSPNDLLTRLRKIVGIHEVKQEKKNLSSAPESTQTPSSDIVESRTVTFTRHGDVIAITTRIGITIDNCSFYRDMFANIVTDGIFKIAFDIADISKIDGAGLGLLLSVNESLKKYSGELRITFPKREIINRFSFIKLNNLFRAYGTLPEVITSFGELEELKEEVEDYSELNLCPSCTYINQKSARYCSFCGTNLIIGRGDTIIETLFKSISKKVISEVQTSNIEEINASRNIAAEEYEIPSELNVEFLAPNLQIHYKSLKTDSRNLKQYDQVAIQAPFLNGIMLPVHQGMNVRLQGTQPGLHSQYETTIVNVDVNRGMIFVRYTEDAKVLHSQKFFSIAPKQPIPVRLTTPSFQNAGELIKGKILELSRIKIVLFSEHKVPTNQCLAISFTLPDENEISSPLVIAQKRKDKFMYDGEFIMIDEKERSNIIQYIYKRQIELARALED